MSAPKMFFADSMSHSDGQKTSAESECLGIKETARLLCQDIEKGGLTRRPPNT